jgi:YesN/AraC family two-component response regulator
VSQLRLGGAEQRPILYERIRFNPTLEALALRRLAEHDIEGCRTALAMLLDRLDLSGAGGRSRETVLLLLDLLHEVNRGLHSPSDTVSYQIHRLALVEEFAACHDLQEARSLFLRALTRLLAPLGMGKAHRHPLVERALAYVEENYASRLSLSTVASQLRVSANYLSRLFRRETGSTLTSHIHRVRLEHALLLLASGGRSLSEIAYLVGYQNYRDFYRNFIKHEKASPRQIRHRLA